MRRFAETLYKGKSYEQIIPVKGLVLVHLFNQTWRIGGAKWVDNAGKKELHSIIYSPKDKEYHVWGVDVEYFYGPGWQIGSNPDPAKVKIYILTSILDDRENWSFDMNIKPEGNKVKVIFENGKIAWIDFKGDWKNWEYYFENVKNKIPCGLNPKWHPSDWRTKDEPQFLWKESIIKRRIIAWRI